MPPMPRSTPDNPRVSRAKSSPLNSVPPRPPARARSGDPGTLDDLKRSIEKHQNGSNGGVNGSIHSAASPASMPSPGGGRRSSIASMPSSGSNSLSTTSTLTPRRNMSNRQRIAQMAAVELGNSISQMSSNVLMDSLNNSNGSLKSDAGASLEGSFELNLNESDHLDLTAATSEASPKSSGVSRRRGSFGALSNSTTRGDRDGSRHGRRDRDSSHHRERASSKSGHRRSSVVSSSSCDRDTDMHRERKCSSGGGSGSRHRRSVDRDTTTTTTTTTTNNMDNSDGSDERKPSSSSTSGGRDRGRRRGGGGSSSGGGGGSDHRRTRSTSRNRRDRKGGSRSRSQSRGARSRSVNGRNAVRNRRTPRGNDRDRDRGARSSSRNWRSPMGSPRTSISPPSDKEKGLMGRSDPNLTLPGAPSLGLDASTRSTGTMQSKNLEGLSFLDSSTRSKVSESDMMDFLTLPKPTRKLGDRGSSDGNRDRDSSRPDSGSRADRKERRERRGRERRGDRSPNRKSGDKSPTRSRSSSADRLMSASSNEVTSTPRSSHKTSRRVPSKSRSGSSMKGLDGFLAGSSNQRSKSISGNRSVASSPAGVVSSSKGRRRRKGDGNTSIRKPSSSRSSSGSNSSTEEDEELDPSSGSYEDEEVPIHQPKSLKDFGERRRPPKKTSSAEDLGKALGLTGERKSSTSKRPTPRRTKSGDATKELSAFLAQPGRRRPPSGGSRSVASSPAGAGTSAGKSRKKKQLEEINNKHNRENNSPSNNNNNTPTSADGKPPSSRSTITTDDPSADEEYDSDHESVDNGAMFHKSFRDMEKERAMQKHMNRTDDLLYSVFPKHIAEALRNGKKVEPENHEMVTIFFSDIVGFTDISSSLDPLKISDMLDRLYNSFDTLSHYHDVFKVETIGDAYMAVTNLTKDQPDHCKRIAMFSADAIRVANQTLIDMDDPGRGHVSIRVGFHSGPVVSNVVGSRNPRYCLFGDTVNTASRMESNSEVNRIHCSDDSAKILQADHPEVRLASRGVINVKGKGKMQTYWVNEDETKGGSGENTFTKSVFNFMTKKTRRGGGD